MGQYDNPAGGIYLVESAEDVGTLHVKNPEQLCFSSQTTLSVDDTADVIDALRQRFPGIEGLTQRRYLLCHTKSSGCGA